MWTITFISFLLITFWIGYLNEEGFASVLPVSTGGLILTLFLLGFSQNMNLIGVIGMIVLGIVALALVLMGRSGRQSFYRAFRSFYLNPQSIVILSFFLLICILTVGHVASWWDDVNYWATDAKGLYYLNGFAGKYGNVAPEFGDYPPGVQIMKWCFAKLNPHEYMEGLAYVGYYIMNLVFALPLISRFKEKRAIWQFLLMCFIFLLPGVANDVWSHGSCSDVTMGILYGSLMISMFDFKEHNSGFYYSRIIILTPILVLTKSVGYEWAAFAAVLFIAVNIVYKADLKTALGENVFKYSMLSIVTGVSVPLIWWCYCLLNRRIAKLTSSGAHMIKSGRGLSDNAVIKAKLFMEGFSFYPMHTSRTWMIDLSSLTMLVILLVVIICMAAFKKISKKEAILLATFTAVTAVIAYGIILLGHLTIFSGETQYETAEVLTISISRYAAPFTIGMMMLLIFLLYTHVDSAWILPAIVAFVLVTTDYTAAYQALWGYRASREEDLAIRTEMIDEAGRTYAQTVSGDESLWGHRVLFFRDDTVVHWVKDTYINHEVSPVPTVYTGINPATMGADEVIERIRESHSEYVYFQDVSGLEEDTALSEKLVSLMDSEESFEYETIYKVAFQADGSLRLYR